VKKLAIATACAATMLGATASAAGPALYPHTWRTKITGAPVAALNATWLLTINRTAFTVKRNGKIAVTGAAKVDGNKLKLRDLTGPFRCRGAALSTGGYSWAIQGNKLRFTRLDDKCRGRSTLLRATYTRVR
jgi:hypothetical protein